MGTVQRILKGTDLQNYCKVCEKFVQLYMRQLIDNTVHLSLPAPAALKFYRSVHCVYVTAKSGPWRQFTWKNRL